MKWWTKTLIIVGIMAILVAISAGILMGMSKEYALNIAIDDEVHEYKITRHIGAALNNRMRYGGSMVEEYHVNIAKGMDNIDALLKISDDFVAPLADIKAVERSKIESEIVFNAKAESMFNYVLGVDGRHMSHGAYESLLWAIDGKGVARELYVIDRAKSLEELKDETVELSSFTTHYNTSGAGRRANIKVAADYINGTIVRPHGIFSFNAIVGERTPERGFHEANIIVNGEYVRGYGGGVCQVSTTLYNAWVLAGGNVEYATAHSLPPHYIEPSRDAMVSSANDMLLRNDSETPIYVYSYCDNASITFKIYGAKSEYRYGIESEVYAEIPIETRVLRGEDLDEYDEIVHQYGAAGLRSRAYLVIYDGEMKEISRENIRDDTYMSQPRIVERVPKTDKNTNEDKA